MTARRGIRRAARTLLAAALVAGAGLVALPAVASASTPADQARAAADYAYSQGDRSGVAVLDTATGQLWVGGDDLGLFPSESVVKVFIAARLLATGQMTGSVATTAYKMITQSDDAAASSLYGRVGGDGLINWVKSHYGIPFLGTPPSRPGWWGNTHITARGMAYFYQRVKADRVVGPWLLNAMHHAARTGSDGFDQWFGIPAATSGAAIKQGWGGDDDAFNSEGLNSTGLVNGDRFTVAILTQHRPYISSSSVRAVINQQARLLMPGGSILNLAAHDPRYHIDIASASGTSVTLAGWTFDPDSTGRSLQVGLFEGDTRLALVSTTWPRPDVNTAYHITGTHGFRLAFTARYGPHYYCLVFYNYGAGTGNVRACRVVGVNGNPVGRVERLAADAAGVHISGWTVDPAEPATSTGLLITQDGRGVYTGTADLPRPDINLAWHVTGNHGFDVTLPRPAGTLHTWCVYQQRAGVTTLSLGCYVIMR
jgi:hypothetical protein